MTKDPDPDTVAEVVVDGSDVHVTLVGDLDLTPAWPLARRLNDVFETTTGTVVLDMSGVTFIGSTGITMLVAAHEQLSAERRSLVLRDVSAETRRAFDLAGLSSLLGLKGTEAADV